MWQCLMCGEFTRTYTEVCRFCSADCLEWMQVEDGQEWGYLLNISSYALSVLPRK
jgi:hypothetical protein